MQRHNKAKNSHMYIMSASYMLLYTTDYAVREKQLLIIEERKPVSNNVSEKY